MTEASRHHVRRNAVTRRDLPAVGAIAAAGAVAAGFSGCHPTGQATIDVVLTGAVAAFTIWLGASASWWSLVAAGWVAVLACGSAPGAIAAMVASAIGLYLGSQRRNLVWTRCLSVAITVQVLLRLQLDPFFGFSALIAGLVLIGLWGVCGTRRRHVVRLRLRQGVLIGGGFVLAAALLFGARVAMTRSQLDDGYQRVLDGLSQLQNGDARGAATTLHAAAARLADVADAAGSVWTQPARLVPVLAQHRNALADVMARAGTAAEAAADALETVDLDSLVVEGGIIDTAQVAILQQPLADLRDAVLDLQAALADADSPWLVGPAADRLHRYQRRADQAAQQAQASAAAAAEGPAMLGADGARTYLIGFMSPAEARGVVGMMGNYAVITMDHGRISRTEFGRTNALGNEVADAGGVRVDMSDEFAAMYGRDTLDDNGKAVRAFWSNVTMSPDVPTVAALMAQVWEGTGHPRVDGVFLVDPAGLAGLLQATGPIRVKGLDQPLNAANVQQFLYLDQYRASTPERSDLLEAVATTTLDGVLNGKLPAPQGLAKALGPAATGGHLVGWARRADEQEMLRLVGMSGAFPPPAGHDGFAVVNNNATANKIDSFLERTVRYDAHIHDARVASTITIRLHNTAPSSGYPDYVIGSEFVDLPLGTNRTLLTVYSPLTRRSASLDGKSVGMRDGQEGGWNAYTMRLDLAPGQTRTVVIELQGTVTAERYGVVVRPQPMAVPDAVSIHVTGDVAIDYTGPVPRRTLIDARGSTALR
ncbi:MAG: DUF4012 domain-containing protein [Actinomycetota bacterium]